ncbi:DUF881 domain-containing protein [Virgisporangium ochraceum]|uniref:UPF0749 protein n=1 Tax=Virgisporangium ochraceum TaxID=65505 RepID=A0A8J4A160_9ACTN|nr:DUF881 domain-containing protein [Virgisporangium ochraceum]GIJ73291.1 UPF0749 protein [Virgisporangium ochraceum]
MSRPHREASDLLADLFRTPLDSGYVDAARRREERGPRPPWQRRGGKAARAVALAMLGFLLAVAYDQVVADKAGTNQTQADLAKEVADRRAEADQLARDAEALRGEVSQRRQDALAADPELLRLQDLEARTGLGRVAGDGVVVTVSDAPAAVDPVTGDVDPENPGRVIDRDLQDLANALWESGAEAVAINGQRLTAITTIRAAGGAILVDFKPVTRPYQLSAIGPDGIEKRMADSATGKRFKRFAETYRMQFDIEARDRLTLPAGDDPGLQYARPPGTPPSVAPSVSGSPR